MERFIHRENIRLYRKQLAESCDTDKRQMLLKLLAEEEAKDGIGPANGRDADLVGKLPNAP